MKPSLLVRALIAIIAIMVATRITESSIPHNNVIACSILFVTAFGIVFGDKIRKAFSS